MSTHTESIVDRVLSTFPSNHYSLRSLLRILEVVESTAVPTACVECGARPRMFVNPDFIAKHAQTPEKLLMLVMHELHHVVLGHTRLFRRVTPIDNLVFDAVINAMLCRLFPVEEFTALFRDYYSANKLPQCFLRPPDRWRPSAKSAAVPAALRKPGRANLRALYRDLYWGSGATYQDLRDAFSALGSEVDCNQVVLLGDHGEEGLGSSSDGVLESRSPLLLDGLRSTTAQWPKPPHPFLGKSVRELLDHAVKPPPLGNSNRLEQLLRRIGKPTASRKNNSKTVLEGSISVNSGAMRLDRRTLAIHALGGRTLLYQHDIRHKRVTAAQVQVHVYLDVSGSIGNLVRPLYAAVLRCRHFVHPVVHLFSTQVADVTFDELRAGVQKTTGGTSIECVAQHMKSTAVKRAVIITDGFVGVASESGSAALKGVTIGVALTPGNSRISDLELFTRHHINLIDLPKDTP